MVDLRRGESLFVLVGDSHHHGLMVVVVGVTSVWAVDADILRSNLEFKILFGGYNGSFLTRCRKGCRKLA